MIILLLISILLSGCRTNEAELATKDNSNIASRGVWLSFSEINNMLLSVRGFEAEFKEAISNCKSLGIEELYVHIRSYCDALYNSDYFPMVEAAKKYDYDIFNLIIENCHLNGIKVHAWINPYRVLTKSSDINAVDIQSPAYKWLNDDNVGNDKNVIIYDGIYLNPAESEARALIVSGVREVVEKYDIDGVHFDDYFYPTDSPDFDNESYELYLVSAGNPISLADWRRANVNLLISGCRAVIKAKNENLVFSISPNASINKNYNSFYADVQEWIKTGLIDCVIPQIYFGFDYPQEQFRFENLKEEWKNTAKLNENVELKIGLASYKIGTNIPPDNIEWQQNEDILFRQAESCYKDDLISGYVFFSYSSLFSQEPLNTKQRELLKILQK